MLPWLSHAQLSRYEKDNLCTEIQLNSNEINAIEKSSNNLIYTDDPIHVIVNQPLMINAKQKKAIFRNKHGFPEYRVARAFQLYSANEYSTPKLRQKFSTNATFKMMFNTTGIKRAILVAKDDEVKVPSKGFQYGAVYNPLCDAIEIRVQAAPRLEGHSSVITSDYQQVNISNITHIIDDYSKMAMGADVNATITVKAMFQGYTTTKTFSLSALYGEDDYDVQTKFRGVHMLSMTINDGGFQRTYYLGSTYVDGIDNRQYITPTPKSPYLDDVIPTVQDVIPTVQDVIPTVQDVIPTVQDVIPTVQDVIPTVQDVIPTVQDVIPTVQDVIPTVQDVIPTVQDVIPTVQDVIPTVQDVIPTIQDVIPTIQDVIPTVQDVIPTIQDAIPVAPSV